MYDNSTLQEKSLTNLSCTVNGDNEAKDFAQLLDEHPQVKGLFIYIVKITNISDAGAKALAHVLNHNSTLKRLDMSNNKISDAGTVALAQALYCNSTLMWLELDGNDGIGEEGTHQLVQALTVNKSIARVYGLVLPKKCEEYATQCEQYNKVRVRIQFR